MDFPEAIREIMANLSQARWQVMRRLGSTFLETRRVVFSPLLANG